MDPTLLDDVEQSLLREPDLDPERAMDRRLGRRILERARDMLEQAWVSEDKQLRWELLHPYLFAAPSPGDYARIAERLDTSTGTVSTTVERLRKRHQKFVRHLTHAEDGAKEVAALRGVVG